MSDVFISYARKDLDFVKGLHASLEARGKSAWVDWEGIPPSAEWLDEIKGAIEEAEAFVFVISPYSCSSEICALELRHAREQGKRLIPVLRAEVSEPEVDASLSGLNWIFLRAADDQVTGVERLLAALDTDLEHVKAHTRLLVRANEWVRGERDESLLLRGRDLAGAEYFIASEATLEPRATAVQLEFVNNSRRAATRRQRLTLITVSAALVVIAGLALVAWNQRGQAIDNAELAEQRRVQEQAAREEAERRLMVSTAQLMSDEAPAQFAAGKKERGLLLARQAHLFNRRAEGDVQGFIDTALRDLLGRPYFNAELEGHTDSILALDFSHDGKLVASASADGTVRVQPVDARAGKARVLRHAGRVAAVAFSPDDRLLATGSTEGLLLWSLSEAKPVGRKVWDTGRNSVVDLVWSPEGHTIYAGSSWPEIVAVGIRGDRAAVRKIAPVELPGGPFESGAGTWIVGSRRLTGPNNLADLELSADGALLVSADFAGNVILWHVEDGSRPRLLPTGRGGKPAVALSPDGSALAVANTGWIIDLHDLKAPDVKPIELEGHTGRVTDLVFSRDGRWLASAGAKPLMGGWEERFDRSVRLWDLRNLGTPPVVLKDHLHDVTAVAFAPDGASLVSGSSAGKIRLWDLTAPRAAPRFLRGHETPVWSAVFGADNRTVVSSSGSFFGSLEKGSERGVKVWDLDAAGVPPLTLPGRGGPAEGLLVSQDGRVLTQQDGNWTLVDAHSLSLDLRSKLVFQPSVALSADGRWLAAPATGGVELHDLSKPDAPARVLENIPIRVSHSALSGSARWLAAGHGHTILVWDLDHPKTAPTELRLGEDDQIFALALSNDDRWLAASTRDRQLLVWRVQALDRQPLSFREHEGAIASLNFSPRGRLVAGGFFDGTVRVWQIDPMQDTAVAVLRGHERAVRSVAFSRDGTKLVTASEDKTVGVWPVGIGVLIEAICRKVRRNLSFEEWQRFVGRGFAYERTCEDLPAHQSLLTRARQLAEQGKDAEALVALDFAASVDAAMRQSDPQATIKQWYAAAQVRAGRELARAGKLDAAAEAFRLAFAAEPGRELDPKGEARRIYSDALVDRARAFIEKRKQSEAAAELVRALDVDREAVDTDLAAPVLVTESLRLARQGSKEEAYALMQRVKGLPASGPHVAPALAREAHSLASAGKLDEALAYLREAVQIDPAVPSKDAEELTHLARDHHVRRARQLLRAGKVAQAREEFAKSAAIDPALSIDFDLEQRKVKATAVMREADALAREGDREGSIQRYLEAEALDAGQEFDREVRFRRLRSGRLIEEAERFAKEGDYDAALAALERAKTFDPGIQLTRERLAHIFVDALVMSSRKRDDEKGLALYRRAYELEPNRAEVLFGLGLFLYWDGQYEVSQEILGRYVTMYPRDRQVGRAHWHMGSAHMSLQNYGLAEVHYLAAVESDQYDHDRKSLADLYSNAARAILRQGRTGEAQAWYAKSFAAYKEVRDLESAARVKNHLGKLLLDEERNLEARAALTEALELAQIADSEEQAERAERHLRELADRE